MHIPEPPRRASHYVISARDLWLKCAPQSGRARFAAGGRRWKGRRTRQAANWEREAPCKRCP